MNIFQKYNLLKKFLHTKPLSAEYKNMISYNFYWIKMEYQINNKNYVVNAYVDKDKLIEFFGYGAEVRDKQSNKIITIINCNPIISKQLYEHGQRHL